jgi:thiamine-monophosphate kinase
MPGEFDLIDWIRAQQTTSDLVKLAAGDDLAILDWKSNDLLLVGCDQVLDGVHFDSSAHSPRAIGRKAMNRNLSDCAAMACLPAAALVSVALPKGREIEYAKELYLGIKEAGEKFGCSIVGGETGTWDGMLALTVTILGRKAPRIPVIPRGGARPGNAIFVTGPLGGSRLGRHMEFVPRVREAQHLARAGTLTAMIDISDGLSRDLRHICRSSGVGAVIRADAVPVHDDAIEMRRDGRSPLEHALHDGEDYELLFTCTGGELDSIQPETEAPWARAVRPIGFITPGPAITLLADGKETPLEPKGWEHTF